MNKICYINLATYSSVGGIENYNKTFLKALDGLEENVVAVSLYDTVSRDDFRHIEFKNFGGNKFTASLYVLKNIYKTKKLIVAHSNLLLIAILSKILNPKIKVYLCVYGVEVWKRFPLIHRFFISRICVLSISNYTTKIFKKYNNLSISNVFYLPPCVNLEINKKFNNVYDKTQFNILSVSRLDIVDNYKGIDSMIRTIPLLIKKIPKLKYTIIGDGNDRGRLERLVQILNLKDYVDFKGYVDSLEPFYQYCDIFSLPSKGEGFGIVFIEAMKFGKPCIACVEGGQVDAVINNETGLLCEYNDIYGLSTRIIDLYQNQSLRKRLGSNGYKHIIKNFTFGSYKERLKTFLHEI